MYCLWEVKLYLLNTGCLLNRGGHYDRFYCIVNTSEPSDLGLNCLLLFVMQSSPKPLGRIQSNLLHDFPA